MLFRSMRDRQVVLLGRHGAVSTGKDPAAAIGLMEAAEELVKTYFIARAVGEPEKFGGAGYKALVEAAMYR
mgnify:FL=1